MKKVIYILAVIFGLGVVSCQKQIVEPCSERSHEAPEWNSAKGITLDDDITTGDSSHVNDDITPGDDGGVTPGDDGGVTPGDITDPNNDPDGKGQ